MDFRIRLSAFRNKTAGILNQAAANLQIFIFGGDINALIILSFLICEHCVCLCIITSLSTQMSVNI